MSYRNGGDWKFTPAWKPTIAPPTAPSRPRCPPLVAINPPAFPALVVPPVPSFAHPPAHHHHNGGGLLAAFLLASALSTTAPATVRTGEVDRYPSPAYRDPFEMPDVALLYWDAREWAYHDPWWQRRFRAAVEMARARDVPPPLAEITDPELANWYRRGWRWNTERHNQHAHRLVEAEDIAAAVDNPRAATPAIKRLVDVDRLTWSQAGQDAGWLLRKIGRALSGGSR